MSNRIVPFGDGSFAPVVTGLTPFSFGCNLRTPLKALFGHPGVCHE